ncbi:hypothetical protein [Enterobacter kobei]|uniref:hypothetical protein n=1 Tax=Enterobacter kobei TaxID=208224 RepID=UPI0035246F70
MSTITREFTKEQLQQIIETDHVQCGEASALARIALASLEAEKERKHHSVIAEQLAHVLSGLDATDHQRAVISCAIDRLNNVAEILQRSPSALPAPPAPVSVPAAMEMDDDFDSAFEHGKAVGWNACRAAMLQGANGTLTNEGTITATQFKPVADLYGLTSPTGGETSFTFDAVEARDFIDGGWSCQEYVELGRFQEAVSGNSPVIPGCSCLTCRPLTFSDSRFVVCPECGNKRCPHANDHRNACTGSNEPGQEGSAYPAAPQQEVTQALAKGMERYGDAMQKLADSGD